MGEKYKVFVYGTLLKGLGNHSILKTNNAKLLGKAKTKAKMLMLVLFNGAFPGMVEDYKGNEKFHCRGEVYEISKLALLQLDYLESEGVLFSREPLKVVMEDGSEDTVFFYKFKGYNYLPKKKEFSVLSSGDWRKRA
jgi:gamma-glutamylcyclotransferase (GGCT)/AIG2-like uncharacterized protein YtfP